MIKQVILLSIFFVGLCGCDLFKAFPDDRVFRGSIWKKDIVNEEVLLREIPKVDLDGSPIFLLSHLFERKGFTTLSEKDEANRILYASFARIPCAYDDLDLKEGNNYKISAKFIKFTSTGIVEYCKKMQTFSLVKKAIEILR
ncbi:MAG: hypothetical protein J0L94_16260 [Rhodothermia bacterium]|nr:hypothetical protein [Rhodothermia bacterium]